MYKDKYLQVFHYLKELSKIRNRVIRDISDKKNDYPEIIWFDELPQHYSVQCVIDKEPEDQDAWLSVKKPNHPGDAPEFVEIPNPCQQWVEVNSLTDEENFPKLKSEIQDQNDALYLEDFPEVKVAFDEYLNTGWIKFTGIQRERK